MNTTWTINSAKNPGLHIGSCLLTFMADSLAHSQPAFCTISCIHTLFGVSGCHGYLGYPSNDDPFRLAVINLEAPQLMLNDYFDAGHLYRL